MESVVEDVDVSAAPMILETDALHLGDDNFFDFCLRNKGWQIERTANGNFEIMQPAGCGGSSGNAELTYQFKAWARRDGTGKVYDCSAGFKLPNSAIRSPDVAWVLKSRLKNFSRADKEKFLPLCPDFVVELRSARDSMRILHHKMAEYMNCGCRLGWLLNPKAREIFIYRPGAEPEKLHEPQQVSGGDVLKGFVLDAQKVWDEIEE
jgi:Uma2 family endonuclease